MDKIIKIVKNADRRYMEDKEVKIRYDTIIISEDEDNL